MIRTIFIENSSYESVLNIQQREFELRLKCRKDKIPLPNDIIIFTEHKPVITLGLHANKDNLLAEIEYLGKLGVDVFQTGRGGDVTYHGPGQLTVYPIIDMTRYNLGVKDYVGLLEESVIESLKEFGIKGERIDGATGVWLDKGSQNERKISAIGVKCSRHITMHGLSLNVGDKLEGFSFINPCGFKEKGVTCISRETGRQVDVRNVMPILESKLISLLRLRIPARENS